MKFKVMQIVFLAVFINAVYAAPSMRRCMILPVRDSVGGAIGFEVFKKVERYLKGSRWCYYKPNSEIINILGNYKNTLDAALENPEVLKLVSEKTDAGSLIRVRINSLPKGAEVGVQVVNDTGKDLYFNQKTEVNSDDPDVIAQTVNNWLDVYEKNIPYDARVTGVLGQQLTLDLGKDAGIYNDYEVSIVRPVKKKRHPLLKEVVDWRTMSVAKARIFHVGKSQSQAKVISYETDTLVQPEDWVIITKTNANSRTKERMNYDKLENDKFSFGKLGVVGLSVTLGEGSNTISSTSSTKKIKGFVGGVEFNGEVWATRNYWVGIDLHKGFGSYSKDEGELQNDSNSVSFTKFKFKAGYKYLPLGFFYGPQIDGYIGYGRYSYGFDNQTVDEIVAVSFKGLLVGARGSIPISKGIRAYVFLDFLLSSSYEEDIEVFGEDESSSNFNIEFGGDYKYSPNMTFEAGLGFINSKAKFEDPEKTKALKNTNIKFGAKFNF